MNTPLYFYFSGKNNHVVKILQENTVKQLHSQGHTLNFSHFLDFCLFIQMYISLFLTVKMEQHAFKKIFILQRRPTMYMDSAFDFEDDMEWKAHNCPKFHRHVHMSLG